MHRLVGVVAVVVVVAAALDGAAVAGSTLLSRLIVYHMYNSHLMNECY